MFGHSLSGHRWSWEFEEVVIPHLLFFWVFVKFCCLQVMSFGVLFFMFDNIQTCFGDGAWFSWFFKVVWWRCINVATRKIGRFKWVEDKWMTRKETEYSDSSFCDCDCDCCKIWVRGANFWEECPRLVFGVLLVLSMISTTLELGIKILVCRESIGIIDEKDEGL